MALAKIMTKNMFLKQGSLEAIPQPRLAQRHCLFIRRILLFLL